MKVKNYLLYALGEILLIVVGVLIAVNINNYNQGKKDRDSLGIILKNVHSDLNSDIQNLDKIILKYEELDNVISGILENKYTSEYFGKINKDNYSDCIPCYGYHIGFESFSPKLDGYNQLKNFNLNAENESKKLSHDILYFYKGKTRDIDFIESSLLNTILKNIELMEEFKWYPDYMLNKYNPNSIAYFRNNIVYKNKLVSFQLLAIENHLSLLSNYKTDAIGLSERIKDQQ